MDGPVRRVPYALPAVSSTTTFAAVPMPGEMAQVSQAHCQTGCDPVHLHNTGSVESQYHSDDHKGPFVPGQLFPVCSSTGVP